MNFIKFLAIFLVVWIGLQMVRNYIQQRKRQAFDSKKDPSEIDNMVKCQHCGTYIPTKQAYKYDQNYYCSEAHAKQGQDEHQ